MNKTIMFLGMLAVGFANAQQGFDGKVGVNTDQPTATLNVKSKTGTNAATKNLELENAASKKIFTVLNDGKTGINNDAPQYLLDLTGNGTSGYSENSIALRGFRTSEGSIALDFFRAAGTPTQPMAVTERYGVGSLNFLPYDGTKYTTSANIQAIVTGDVKDTETVPVSFDFRVRAHTTTGTYRVMRIHHTGNIGIGAIGTPTHPLHIKPVGGAKDPIRLEGLQAAAGTGNQPLVVDADGVVKLGTSNSATNSVARDGAPTCSGANDAGKINFGEITLNGTKTEAFGFCMKNGTTGNYGWFYIYGAKSTTSSSGGAFGNELQ